MHCEYPELKKALNLIEGCWSCPLSRDSNLASQGLMLFDTKAEADMEFELRHDTVSPLAFTQDSFVPTLDSYNSASVHIIPAHRVIVCARCPWFLRALTSGMREERERKIVLRDCPVDIFNLFLKVKLIRIPDAICYLYSCSQPLSI